MLLTRWITNNLIITYYPGITAIIYHHFIDATGDSEDNNR